MLVLYEKYYFEWNKKETIQNFISHQKFKVRPKFSLYKKFNLVKMYWNVYKIEGFVWNLRIVYLSENN